MAVYTEVSFEELERLLEQYDIGVPLSFKGIAEGIENSNFYLQTDRGAFFLTLYEKRVAAADLPFFLGLMEHLAKAGVNCPLPVKTRDGRSLVNVNRRNAANVTVVPGIAPGRYRHFSHGHRAAPPRCRALRRRRLRAGRIAHGWRRLRADPRQCAGSH